MRGTTIVAVRKNNEVVVAGDGQVTMGTAVMKHGAKKVRRLEGGDIIVGFAGSTADAFTLFERLEAKLKEYGGSLRRAAVELAKDWRTDKMLRQLEALLIATDSQETLVLSGSGDVISPDSGVAAIGSGGKFAEAAALALLSHSDLPARAIAEVSMGIAADICIYTNNNLTVEVLKEAK